MAFESFTYYQQVLKGAVREAARLSLAQLRALGAQEMRGERGTLNCMRRES